MYEVKRNLEPWFEMVEINTNNPHVVIKSDLQRPVSETKVKRLVKTWDDSLIGVLEASLQADGTIHIPDGQHRWVAGQRVAILRGTPVLFPVKLWHNLSAEQEAGLFLGINVHRGPVQAKHQWPIRRALGDEVVLGIDAILAEFDLKTTVDCTAGVHRRQWNTVGSVAGLERIYRVGGASLLRRSLDVALSAFPGEPFATEAMFLLGVAWFLNAFEDDPEFRFQFKRDRLIERLRETSIATMRKAASALVARAQYHGSEAYAHALVDLYNFHLQNRLPVPQLRVRPLSWSKFP